MLEFLWPAAFLALARSVADGSAEVVARVEVDENGDTNVILSFPIEDSE